MIGIMRVIGESFFPDWIILTVRWIFLIAVCLWLAIGIGISWAVVIFILVEVIGNIVFTSLIVTKKMIFQFRILSILGDMAFAYLLTYLSLPLHGDLGWFGLLPLIGASLYFQWLGAVVVAFVNILVQSVLAMSLFEFNELFIWSSFLFFLYLAGGLPMAFLGQYLNKRQETISQSHSNQRRDSSISINNFRIRIIYELVSALSATLNYQRVLEISLDMSEKTLAELNAPADKLVSAVLLFKDGEDGTPHLEVATSRRMASTDYRIELAGKRGVIGLAIDEGASRLTQTPSTDPELSYFVALQSCGSAYCIPLRIDYDTYGMLLFAHPESEFFLPMRREILDIVGHQSVIAIQNARLYQDLEQEKERMMEIQEEARKKMARDLHDGPTQSVSAIAMRVNFSRLLFERDPKAAAEEMFKIEELARRTTKEIRHMLFTLRPLVLESQGLIAALESMAEKMNETYNQNVIIQADQRVVDSLEMGKQTVVFYIAEEAVTNARKHAHADNIYVRLKMLADDMCLLEIEDDGAGFDTHSVDIAYENRGSLGMINMRERTELVNGALRIDSVVGRGTRIELVVPLTEEAADRIRHRVF